MSVDYRAQRRQWYRTARYLGYAAGLLYLAVLVWGWYGGAGMWYDALYWITQSACIGAVADYVAVEALFRKPFGFPWHTRLLPRKREAIAEQVAYLVEHALLQRDRWLAVWQEKPVVPYIDQYYDTPEGQKLVAQGLSALLARTQSQWPIERVLGMAQEQLARYPITVHLGQVRLSPQWIVPLVPHAQAAVQTPAVQQILADFVRARIDRMQEDSLLTMIGVGLGRLFSVVDEDELARNIQEALVDYIAELADPKSTAYAQLEQTWEEVARQMREGGLLAMSLQALWRSYMEDVPITRLWESHGAPWLASWLALDAEGCNQAGRQLAEGLHQVWTTYRDNPAFIQAVQRCWGQGMALCLEAFGSVIPTIVRVVLGRYDEETFNAFVEEKIAADLNGIRINGVVVGAALGGCLWVLLLGYDAILAWLLPHMGFGAF